MGFLGMGSSQTITNRHRSMRSMRVIVAGLLATGLFRSGAYASDLSPTWVDDSTSENKVNGSFLNNVKIQMSDSSVQSKDIMDPKACLELSQRYDDLNRSYDMRKNYHVADMGDEYTHAQQVSDFSHDVFNQISHKQVRDNGDKLMGAVNRDDNLKQAEKPAAVVGVAYAIYSGQPLDLKLDGSSKFISRTNLSNSTAELVFDSPIIYTSIDYTGLAPETRDPNAISADPNFYKDRYAFALRRPLPIFDLSTSLSYGSTSTNLTASVSKPITNNLTCVVDSSMPMSAEIAAVVPASETLRLLYGIRF